MKFNFKMKKRQHLNTELKTQPSPDNQGLEIEKPKNVDVAAAEVNRDVGELSKIDPTKISLRQNKNRAK